MEALLNHRPRWIFYVNHRTSHIANQDVRSCIGDVVSNLFESNVAGVTNFPFEGHYAMKNVDEANEVQENAVKTKTGKSEG